MSHTKKYGPLEKNFTCVAATNFNITNCLITSRNKTQAWDHLVLPSAEALRPPKWLRAVRSLDPHCNVLGSRVQKGSDLTEVFLLLFFMRNALGSKGCVVIPVEYVSSSKCRGSNGHLCDIFKPGTTSTMSSAFLSSFLRLLGSLWRCLVVAGGVNYPAPCNSQQSPPQWVMSAFCKAPKPLPRPPCWTCLTPPVPPRRQSGATTWGPITHPVTFAL